MLDKACRYLVDQGFGVLELAFVSLGECTAMAHQRSLAEAVYGWLQEAKEEAKVHRRSRGFLRDDLTWRALTPRRLSAGATAPATGKKPQATGRGLRHGS